MNGTPVAIVMFIIGGLLGLVQVLFGLLLKLHKETDDERIQEIKEEVIRIRDRMHDISSAVGKVDQWQRFRDDDERNK